MTTNTDRATAASVLHDLLAERRSSRAFSARPLTDDEVRSLCWAAQGVTDATGRRTAPSAGATYSLELYAVTAAGAWHFDPASARLDPHAARDLRRALQRACANQDVVTAAPLAIVIAAVPARLAARLGPGNDRYLLIEAGHAAQNVLLEATVLGLASRPIGLFDEAAVRQVLGLGDDFVVLEIVLAGKPVA